MKFSTLVILVMLGVIVYLLIESPARRAFEKQAAEQRQRDMDRQEKINMEEAARQAQLLNSLPGRQTPTPTPWGTLLDRGAYRHR